MDIFTKITKMISCIINRIIISYRNRHIFLKNHAKFALMNSYRSFTKTLTNILRKSAQKVTWIYNAKYEVNNIRKTLENTGFSRVLWVLLKICKYQISFPSVLRLLDYIPAWFVNFEIIFLPVLLLIYSTAMYLSVFSRNWSFRLINDFLCSPIF